jgi:hypothetical protein
MKKTWPALGINTSFPFGKGADHHEIWSLTGTVPIEVIDWMTIEIIPKSDG